MDDGADRAPAHPAGRPLLVQQDARKPLFATASTAASRAKQHDAQQKPDLARYRPPASARRTNSESFPARRDASGTSPSPSPSSTRIPKPATASPVFSHRRPMSLADAYKMAEHEETRELDTEDDQPIDASPSPAPRSWRDKRDPAQTRAQQLGGGTPGASRPRSAGTTDKSPSEAKADWRSRPTAGSEWLKDLGPMDDRRQTLPDLVPGIEDVPFPSVEQYGAQSSPGWARRSPTRQNSKTSPEKSFAWQVDEDFTAGDLQVSDSPRVKVADRPFSNRLPFDDDSDVRINSPTRVNNPGSQNTKLDEIRSREVRAGSNIPILRPDPTPRKSKLDEIRARESEVEKKIPIPDRHLSATKNTKLDEIRQRESQGLTKRQLAAARLEEIKEQNAASRMENRFKQRFEPGGSPVAGFKARNGGSPGVGAGSSPRQKNASTKPPSHARRDSRDALRQLARATSSSPASEPESKKSQNRRSERNTAETATARGGTRRAFTANSALGGRGTNTREARLAAKGNSKPSVEFAGLRRVRSTESTGSKRSSVHSEMDPTDRIEGEMKLFAPLDNHSEKGSVRASSPSSDPKREGAEDEEVEATPKARKDDPLTMPTPRVTGAYVDTPVTVKVDKHGLDKLGDADKKSIKSEPLSPGFRDRGSWERDSFSDPGEDEKSSSSRKLTAAIRPRARSHPRRSQPLRNSAKPPSVRDDLLQLQRLHNIDDDTIDDLEGIINGRMEPSPMIEALIESLQDPPTSNDSFDLALDLMKQKLERPKSKPVEEESAPEDEEKTLEPEHFEAVKPKHDKMHMKIQASLQDMAKEGKQNVPFKPKPSTHVHTDSEKCATCAATEQSPTLITYMHLPVPRLYHRKPTFRLTLPGILVFALMTWYMLESIMCGLYCRPTSCSQPCAWSYKDPEFGSAIPIKLDQWVTGGSGREAFNDALVEAEDFIADVLDAMYGRDITQVDVKTLSYAGKRAHRRRLRKKGLGKSSQEAVPPEVQARWDAWHRERLAREKQREMGYGTSAFEDESVGGDQRIW